MAKNPVFLFVGLAFLSIVSAWDLTVLHTNDIHAHFEQMSNFGGECTEEEAAKKECYGGYARQATAIKQIRDANDNVLLLSGGDWSQGTVWYYKFEGAASALMMNQLGYDAGAIGNHEFDKTVPVFVDKFVNNVSFPVLSANCDASKEPEMQGKFQKSVTLDMNGKKVGVIGYTTSLMNDLSITLGNLVFTDEVEAVKIEAQKLKDEGVDIIVAVGHSGFPTDKRIAQEVPHVDVVVGGHDNSFLYKGDPPSIEEPKAEYPHVEEQQETGRQVPVLVVQDYMFGKYLGNLKVTFDDAGEATEWTGNPILLDAKTYEEDAAVLKTLEPMKAELFDMRNLKIGDALVSYIAIQGSVKMCRVQECNIGNLNADSMVETEARYEPERVGWTRAAAAFANAGGIRGNLADTPGTVITNGKLLEAFPFANTVDMVILNGSTLYKVFEHSASLWEERKGRFLQVSGFRVVYDMEQEVGSRVQSLEIRCADCITPVLEAVDMTSDKQYNVLTSSYVANGGDGFHVIPAERHGYFPLGYLDSDVIREYISKYTPLYGGTEGRIFTKPPFPCSKADDDTTGGAARLSGVISLVIAAAMALLY